MFYAICIFVCLVVAIGDRILPYVDAAAAIWNLMTIVAVLIALASTAKQGRHSASYGLSNYQTSFSGWGQGFTFFIGTGVSKEHTLSCADRLSQAFCLQHTLLAPWVW